jgi:biotin carboxyl carrier protein
MNQYSLMEIEYEDKDEEQTLKIRRDSQESSPPLLEGRTDVLPGQVRASTVGRIEWDAEDGDTVNRGEVLATISKQDESIPVKAPQGGELIDVSEDEWVEFGETLARVVSDSVGDEEET